MKKPIKYTNEPIEARVIPDFLPPPRKHRNGAKWVFWAEEPEADARD